MRLAIVSHTIKTGGGHARVNYEIARAALRQGYATTLVADQVSPDLTEHSGATWMKVGMEGYPTQLLRNLVFAGRCGRPLRRWREGHSVLQVSGFITWEPCDVNTCHMVHGDWLRSPMHTFRLRRDLYGLYQWMFTALNARLELKAYTQAKVVVAVSERVRRQLIAIGVPEARIQVLLNGVDLDEFYPGKTSRESLGLPESVPLGVFVGDLRTPLKNLDTVLHAMQKATALHLAVVGATEGSPSPALAKRLGVEDRVHFLGYRRDVAPIMRAADVFVFPSRTEACPLVLFEAMASGLPVITAATVGACELVVPDCGIVLPDPNDAKALANAIEEMLNSPEQRRCMGFASRSVAEQHSWKTMTDAYLELYEKVGS